MIVTPMCSSLAEVTARGADILRLVGGCWVRRGLGTGSAPRLSTEQTSVGRQPPVIVALPSERCIRQRSNTGACSIQWRLRAIPGGRRRVSLEQLPMSNLLVRGDGVRAGG